MPFYSMPTHEGSSIESLQALLYEHKLPPFTASFKSNGRGFRWRSDMVLAPQVALLRAHYNQDWSLRPGQAERAALSVIVPTRGGGFEARLGARTVSVATGTALVTPTDRLERIDMISQPALLNSTLIFPAAAVQRTLASFLGDASPKPVDMAPVVNFGTPAGRWLQSTLQSLASGMLGGRLLERSPLAMELLVEAALNILFTQFAVGADTRLEPPDQAISGRQVRRAIDYMHDSLHLPITVADVSAAAGVSSRSLQLAFRRDLGTTPTNYLLHLRLQAVHCELSNPENTLSIHEVALKWGFVHMGRFASYYRKTFGFLPSETAHSRSSLR